ncbi:MAG TPA: FAD binding domain-containing protein [Streptosporangiaceae bacterium]|jgi:carbon-monoxide dehydrogenase medium subunit
MVAQAFEYRRAAELPEVLAVLTEHGDDAKVLAGGQSLVPMMHLRLARPGVVVDINRLPGLDGVSAGDGELRLGALVRHRRLERPVVGDPLGALLAAAARHVGHLPIRARGTFAGSLAHADPAAEWCLVAVAVAARLVLASSAGERVVAADDFFDYPFVTALRADELITEVRLPLLGPATGVAFREQAPTAGAFAHVAACATATVESGRVTAARLALGGVAGRPRTLPGVVAPLVGAAPEDEALDWAFDEVRHGVLAAVDPPDDLLVPADYRRALAAELAVSALAEAIQKAPR